ncbi:MAG TPA: hypothetical protein VK790_03410 [Solirubrobacteraceae bacterium]|jgi:hypothetical protein|nr:hypothetical protein [Solirubrobacteraceae bacterium]
MSTLLADSPPVPENGQPEPDGSNGAPAGQAPVAPQLAPAVRACSKCGAELAAGQDWCLQCGAGAPGSLGTPGWRSAAVILGVVTVLVLGAAAAAVAALTKGTGKAPVVIATVAPPPAPTASTPAGTGATTPGAPGTTSTPGSTLPTGTTKPPKIPLTAATPKASETTATTTPSTSTPSTTTTTGTTPSSGTGTTGKSGEESQQSAILLDTNAASTYNPYGYPAAGFGDPSLAIDEDQSTAWTAQVNPATAPKMAQGLLIDLKAQQKVAVLQLISSTPGMTVQVYGANATTAPASITDPAWIPLSSAKVAKKRKLRLKLRDARKQFTFITLWISNAPQSALGTAQAPGHVDVNEVELFPPKS